MNTRATLIALALVATAGSVHAAPTTYTIDSTHTSAFFSYDHLGLTYQTQGFKKLSGKVTIDPETATGEADVTVDVKSLDTGVKAFTEHLHGPDFFDSAKFPTMNFKSTKFNYAGTALQTMEGNLTIKGITKPVIFAVSNYVCKQHPMLKKEACGANAITQISRTAWGLGKFTPGVGDDVTLNIMIEAVK